MIRIALTADRSVAATRMNRSSRVARPASTACTPARRHDGRDDVGDGVVADPRHREPASPSI